MYLRISLYCSESRVYKNQDDFCWYVVNIIFLVRKDKNIGDFFGVYYFKNILIFILL